LDRRVLKIPGELRGLVRLLEPLYWIPPALVVEEFYDDLGPVASFPERELDTRTVACP